MRNNRKLLAWVEEVKALCKPDRVEWANGSARGVRPPAQRDGGVRQRHPVEPPKTPQQLPVPFRSLRRGPRREPHLYRLRPPGGRGAHQQLDRPRRAQEDHAASLRWMHARPNDVCHSLLHGPHRFPDRQNRRGDHRLRLRGGEHARHGARGRQGPGGAGRRRRVHPVPAFHRVPPVPRARRQDLALRAPGAEIHFAFP